MIPVKITDPIIFPPLKPFFHSIFLIANTSAIISSSGVYFPLVKTSSTLSPVSSKYAFLFLPPIIF